MFTGIISHLGKIIKIENHSFDKLIIIACDFLEKIKIGDSIACDGVCLTITKIDNNHLSFFVSKETLKSTIISSWQEKDIVNLELAMKLGERLNGHIVSGHIDNVASILNITKTNNSYVFQIAIPNKSANLLIYKGSVTINGISLTVNEINKNSFSVNIIPHSFVSTNLQYLKKSDMVNIEFDLIGKYINRKKSFYE